MADFNYAQVFRLALNEIKLIRNPHGTISEMRTVGSYSVCHQQLINIGGDEFDTYESIVRGARETTKRYIYNIVASLLEERAPYCTVIPQHRDKYEAARRPFVFIDTRTNCLLLIKEMCEGVSYGRTTESIPYDVKPILDKTCATSFKEIYLLHDYAYLQFAGHSEDEKDPGRGVNAYSFSWFFDTYFGTGEYEKFYYALEVFRHETEDYLGYTITRTLNPTALVNFKKLTEHTIKTLNYRQLLRKTLIDHRGNTTYLKGRDEYEKLFKQFFEDQTYTILLGSHDFSESLITAEWLRHSMKKANAVDLTVIGTGYFKAVEQLLFELIQVRIIDYCRDVTLGELATFYKDNSEVLFRDDVHWSTKKYVIESMYAYAKLRNGYFHKDNIHDPNKIELIRSETYFLLFLLLGCRKVDEQMLKKLGMPDRLEYDGFSQLCEYVSFYLGGSFCIETEDGTELWAGSNSPLRPKFSQYTGVVCACFNEFDTNENLVFTRENMPRRVWVGCSNSLFSHGSFHSERVKEHLIFENGKYVGPSIVEEIDFDY